MKRNHDAPSDHGRGDIHIDQAHALGPPISNEQERMPGVPGGVSAVRALGPLAVVRNLIQIARYEARRLDPPARASAATITFYSHRRSGRTDKP